ncbi:MAG: regulatory protein RecX [Chloroflexi bacterium]|nr:regulatory protein RecX [Chloroflexota bacterium]
MAVRRGQRADPMAMALRFMASRARSEAEVRRRLASRGVDDEDIEGVLERLRALGYVDDAEFAAAVIQSRRQGRARGLRLVEDELRAKGVSDEVLREALEHWYGDEVAVARPVAERQAERLQGRGFGEFRQRLGAFLVRRGFEHATAESLVTELWETYGAPD